uniref:Uncharacterized protein n=1 Tax=Anguilla anguilla TaxID=7936 RepID=A0A0E9QV54_ANGAN
MPLCETLGLSWNRLEGHCDQENASV